jgi:hypothetical protein
MTSTVAVSSARRIGCSSGASRTAVPMVMRRVTAAIAADTTSSDGMYPSSKKWCSEVQMESRPASSHARASSSASR